MAIRRCPNCQTLNAEHADQCSRCGRGLAREIEPAPGVHFAPALPRRIAARATGIAALVGAGLFFITYLAARLPFLGILAPLMPYLPVPGLPPLLSFITSGALAGAFAGGVAALARRTAAGVIVSAVLFAASELRERIVEWSGVVWYDKVYPLVMGPALVSAAAALGALFGYMVALTVHRYMQAAHGDGPD